MKQSGAPEPLRVVESRESSEPRSLERISAGVAALIAGLGEDPGREGLRDTPLRSARAWLAMTEGYGMDPAEILGTRFSSDGYEGLVHVGPVEFVSFCEHHLLPIQGEAHVAYVPRDQVVGLSKLPRLVLGFAKRLQVQERLTQQIADAIETELRPRGAAVSVRARHFCTCGRGVTQRRSIMTTRAFSGELKSNASLRAEFLELANAPGDL